MTCKEHSKYQGKRVPQGDCKDCWKIYFETDTETKKKKYPDQYKEFMTVAPKTTKLSEKPEVKSVEDKPIVKKIEEPENISRDANGKITADIPIIINKYFYSEERKSTLKLVGFVDNSLIFIEDHKIIIPLKDVEALELIPQSDSYFTYSTRRVPPEAQNKTMRVFPLDKPDLVIKDVQDPSKKWQTEDTMWGEDDKLVVEDFPKEEHQKKSKKSKKKLE